MAVLWGSHFVSCVLYRARGSRLCWKVLWGRISCLVVLVRGYFDCSRKTVGANVVVRLIFSVSSAGIVTRRPLVLQLHKIDEGREYAEFLHLPKKRFADFGNVACQKYSLTLVVSSWCLLKIFPSFS